MLVLEGELEQINIMQTTSIPASATTLTSAAALQSLHSELHNQFNSNLHRQFFIGFDQLFNQLDNKNWRSPDNAYPPHSIVRLGDDSFAIELAVAGFKSEELDIEFKEAILSVKGLKTDRREYDYKGISSRPFTKTFRLAEYVQVINSTLEDGILSITLKRIIPEEKRAKKIKISTVTQSLLSQETPNTTSKEPLQQLNG